MEKQLKSSLHLLKESCQLHPHLKVKIAVDSLDKNYISLEESADFMGLEKDRWETFLENYREGNVEKIPLELRNLVPETETRFLTGFTRGQLAMLTRALEIPFLIVRHRSELLPLLNELRFLMMLGVILRGKHKLHKSFEIKVIW